MEKGILINSWTATKSFFNEPGTANKRGPYSSMEDYVQISLAYRFPVPK